MIGWIFRASDPLTALRRRNEFVAYLRALGSPECDFEAAALVYGELVANVVRHAPGPLEIVLEWEQDDAVLHVIDHGKGFELVPALPGELSERGRGLFIVRALSRELRVLQHDGGGSEVCVTLPIRRRHRPPRSMRGRALGIQAKA